MSLLVRPNWSSLVNGFTNNIDDSAQCFWSHWNSDGSTSILADLASNKTFSTIHGNGANSVLP